MEGSIDLRRKKKEEVIKMLIDKKYDTIDDDNEFKYLIKMPMDSVTEENVLKLNKEHADKKEELGMVKKITTSQMWLKELDSLYKEYSKYKEERSKSDEKTEGGIKIKVKSKPKVK